MTSPIRSWRWQAGIRIGRAEAKIAVANHLLESRWLSREIARQLLQQRTKAALLL